MVLKKQNDFNVSLVLIWSVDTDNLGYRYIGYFLRWRLAALGSWFSSYLQSDIGSAPKQSTPGRNPNREDFSSPKYFFTWRNTVVNTADVSNVTSSSIQQTTWATLAYTAGTPSSPHPIPQDTIPLCETFTLDNNALVKFEFQSWFLGSCHVCCR